MPHFGLRRQAFTVLELLVVFSVLAVLIGVLLPAVVAAREASNRLTCTNNLRQVGVGLQQFHESHRVIPEAWHQAGKSTTVYGWAVDLLPFMEHSQLHQNLDRKAPLTASTSDAARMMSWSVMLCPSDVSVATFPLHMDSEDDDEDEYRTVVTPHDEPVLTHLPTANYVGVFGTIEADDDFPAPLGDGAVIAGRRTRFADLQRGLSKTLLVGERTMAMIPSTWLGVDVLGEDATCRLVGSAMTRPNCVDCDECEFGSRHPGGANFLWADGHVSHVSDQICGEPYRQIARRW